MVEAGRIDRARFENDIVAAAQPVVLRGLVAEWPAVRLGRESPEAICRYLVDCDSGAPVDVLLRRVEARTTNSYGRTAEERALILRHAAEVEPLLRDTCTHEIDAAQPIGDVVAQLAEIGRS